MSGDGYENIDYFIGMDTTDWKKELEDAERKRMSEKLSKLKKEVVVLEAKEQAKKEKWYMFESPKYDCNYCKGRGHVYHQLDFGFSDKVRCDCSMKKTKRYKEHLNNEDMTVKEHKKKTAKFVDNNASSNSNIHDKDRSW